MKIFSVKQTGYWTIISILGINLRILKIKKLVSDLYKMSCNIDNINNITGHVLKFENNINRIIQNNISTACLHQKTFLKYKNINKNREIVILATGPSAKNYRPIQDAIHIGVNRAFLLDKIFLDYIFIQDYSGETKEYIEDLNNYQKDKCKKFYGLTTEYIYEPERTIPENDSIDANASRYRTDWAPIDFFQSKFAYDISTQPLGCFGSVVFPALQFALWTNPKKIYLVGCDCSNAGYAYDEDVKNNLDSVSIIKAYSEFKEFAHKYYPDVEIVSINPVGLAGMFIDEYQE